MERKARYEPKKNKIAAQNGNSESKLLSFNGYSLPSLKLGNSSPVYDKSGECVCSGEERERKRRKDVRKLF